MASGADDGEVVRIGMPELAATPGRFARFCAEASLALAVMGPACIFLGSQVTILLPEGAVIGVLLSAIAFVLGIVGRRQGGESKLVATIGILLSIPSFTCLCVPFYNCGGVEFARRTQLTNNLKQVGLALHNYHSEYGRLPPAVVRDREGRPLYSWRVLILPYMEANDVYKKFYLDERWDSPHNKTLLGDAPYAYSGIGVEGGRLMTYLQAFVGPGSAFEGMDGEPFTNPDGSSNFPDGMDTTFAVVESREGVPWSAPFDLPFGPDLTTPPLGGGFHRGRGFLSSEPANHGFLALMADGSVRWMKLPIAPSRLRAFITRNGGEAVSIDP